MTNFTAVIHIEVIEDTVDIVSPLKTGSRKKRAGKVWRTPHFPARVG